MWISEHGPFNFSFNGLNDCLKNIYGWHAQICILGHKCFLLESVIWHYRIKHKNYLQDRLRKNPLDMFVFASHKMLGTIFSQKKGLFGLPGVLTSGNLCGTSLIIELKLSNNICWSYCCVPVIWKRLYIIMPTFAFYLKNFVFQHYSHM